MWTWRKNKNTIASFVTLLYYFSYFEKRLSYITKKLSVDGMDIIFVVSFSWLSISPPAFEYSYVYQHTLETQILYS